MPYRKINRYRIKKYRELTLPISYIVGTNEKKFVTTKDIALHLSTRETIIIPRGYRFDGASVPRGFWWFIPRLDDRILAVLLHDYLYWSDYGRDEMGDAKAKMFIDKEFLLWMNVQLGDTLNKIKNYTAYYSVKLFGWKIFKRRNTEFRG